MVFWFESLHVFWQIVLVVLCLQVGVPFVFNIVAYTVIECLTELHLIKGRKRNKNGKGMGLKMNIKEIQNKNLNN